MSQNSKVRAEVSATESKGKLKDSKIVSFNSTLTAIASLLYTYCRILNAKLDATAAMTIILPSDGFPDAALEKLVTGSLARTTTSWRSS